MTGRLKLIEQQLLGIDSAAFQNLCDLYLKFREQEFTSFNRTGSQFGKQKTVKGTPDTFFRLNDGSLSYVEFTTKADNIVTKMKEDIDKCLDPSKTGIPANEVHKIIICFNSRIKVEEETEIVKYANNRKIRITLIGLDLLALEIYSKYIILAKDILGIPLDTGQILPLDNFILEYNNKGGKLSTPIDNIFLNRKLELENTINALDKNDLVVISGFPGVGKTKLALEVVNQYLINNKDFGAFAVSKKDIDIWEDLKINLEQDKNYILLVDDANRQLPNFKQILGVFKELRKAKLKLILTVRDYAYEDVLKECFELNPEKVVLGKFTDEEITQLISSDSFKILNPKYQKRIIQLSDGNARLAVMCSRLAQEKQWEFLQGDISDLYDSYFQTFIKDFDVFSNKTLIKTLGIVSFFYTIERDNKQFVENILKDFEIDYHEFQEAIEELHKKELVEIQYNHVRISEQIMSTYFFYKVFIKDKFLPFKVLLFNYFENWKHRFKDTIIPANNSFGYENVFSQINADLDSYLKFVYTDEEKVLEFFKIFWFYKRDETLTYFYNKISEKQEPVNPNYDSTYQTNDFVYEKDLILSYLTDFFNFYSENYISALELSFEHVRKDPASLPELVRRIREKIIFDDEDSEYNFKRQVELFNFLTKKFGKNEPHYVEAYFALSKTFLGHYFQIFKGGRNHTFTHYRYPLPFTETTKSFRKQIWETLIQSYEIYPEKVFNVIKDYQPSFREIVKEVLLFDLTYILPFAENKLDKNKFKHCYYVQDLVFWLDREEIENKSYRKLKSIFNSDEYKTFRKLDWNSYRGKQDYEFTNHEEFRRLKESDVREYFVFKDENEFQTLFNSITNILSLEGNNAWGLQEALNIIFEENFIKNEELGFKLIESFLANYPLGINPLYKPIKLITASENYCLKLWSILKNWNHDYKIFWQLTFFECLPVEFIDKTFANELIDTIQSIDRRCYLHFDSFEKFESINQEIIKQILVIVNKKNAIDNLGISLQHNFFEKYTNKLKDNIDLIYAAYLYEDKTSNHFDYERKGLKNIAELEPNFMIEYITLFYGNDDFINRDKHNNLTFVWDLDNIELVKVLVEIIISKNPYFGIGEYTLSIFFNHLNDSQRAKAEEFISNFISTNYADRNKMNAIFDVIRHFLNEYFEKFLLFYLTFNSELKSFEKIYWRGNGGTVHSGDVNFGELEAADWNRIYDIIVKGENQLQLIPIKNYVKKQIEYSLKYAEEERKRKFANPNW
ncbi:nSTAND3 domain-containing NTPase [Flavobacterium hibisci]|uniref:nSTAND3 domain-containing NTPase n=1 Tax=Flavobacterium hibisci TaxID=1914462 RepID=UPI001CC074C5|nr:hypothetical protein [Flavobacterium hibisci]MBZ4042434.1 hypothetical protein [Flavobacterium hibisci]